MYSFRGRKNEHLIDRDQPVYEIGSGPVVMIVEGPFANAEWLANNARLNFYYTFSKAPGGGDPCRYSLPFPATKFMSIEAFGAFGNGPAPFSLFGCEAIAGIGGLAVNLEPTPGVLLHELSHVLFGLEDEYPCATSGVDTHRSQDLVNPNIFSSEANCLAQPRPAGAPGGPCREVPACRGAWWRFDGDPDIMGRAGFAATPYQVDCVRAVRSYFGRPEFQP
jgi:hypothetical protein